MLTPDAMEIRYRNVPTLRERFVVSALFQGQKSSLAEIDEKLEAASTKRKLSQPIASSAGCIFKNPAACPAGKLVEELGLKNRTVGAARVSEIHGNFIVNDDGVATAREVLKLISQIQETAKQQRGIELELEVQVVGVDDETY